MRRPARAVSLLAATRRVSHRHHRLRRERIRRLVLQPAARRASSIGRGTKVARRRWLLRASRLSPLPERARAWLTGLRGLAARVTQRADGTARATCIASSKSATSDKNGPSVRSENKVVFRWCKSWCKIPVALFVVIW
jgi:hypothetical protein